MSPLEFAASIHTKLGFWNLQFYSKHRQEEIANLWSLQQRTNGGLVESKYSKALEPGQQV